MLDALSIATEIVRTSPEASPLLFLMLLIGLAFVATRAMRLTKRRQFVSKAQIEAQDTIREKESRLHGLELQLAVAEELNQGPSTLNYLEQQLANARIELDIARENLEHIIKAETRSSSSAPSLNRRGAGQTWVAPTQLKTARVANDRQDKLPH